jgi:hypothetical protein
VSEAIQLDHRRRWRRWHIASRIHCLVGETVSARIRADLSIRISIVRLTLCRRTALERRRSRCPKCHVARLIERNQVEIDKAESEIAGQASDVSPKWLA